MGTQNVIKWYTDFENSDNERSTQQIKDWIESIANEGNDFVKPLDHKFEVADSIIIRNFKWISVNGLEKESTIFIGMEFSHLVPIKEK